MNTTPPNACPASEPAKAGHEAKLIRSQDWFGRSSVVFIEHRGERYQLRQTRNGKLILTK
jgi:hemin uptake protein HemP